MDGTINQLFPKITYINFFSDKMDRPSFTTTNDNFNLIQNKIQNEPQTIHIKYIQNFDTHKHF